MEARLNRWSWKRLDKCANYLVCRMVLVTFDRLVDRTFYDPVAFFTVILAVSTIGLWVKTSNLAAGAEAQGQDIKAQIRATEAFAAAATKSANIAEETQTIFERPYVYLADIYGISKERGVPIKATNYGRTPAILRHIRANFVIRDKRPYPPYPREKGTTFSKFYVLGTGNSTDEFDYTIGDDILLEEIDENYLAPVLHEGQFAYLVVTVTFDDVKGKEHEAGTCWRYYRKDGNNYFIRHTDPKCHYQT